MLRRRLASGAVLVAEAAVNMLRRLGLRTADADADLARARERLAGNDTQNTSSQVNEGRNSN